MGISWSCCFLASEIFQHVIIAELPTTEVSQFAPLSKINLVPAVIFRMSFLCKPLGWLAECNGHLCWRRREHPVPQGKPERASPAAKQMLPADQRELGAAGEMCVPAARAVTTTQRPSCSRGGLGCIPGGLHPHQHMHSSNACPESGILPTASGQAEG